MKATLGWLGAVVAALALTGDAPAQYLTANTPPPQGMPAPDMCIPGFVYSDGRTMYGPSYYVYPPFPVYTGVGYQPPAGFYNPYVRSPRDYFMWSEAQKERSTREIWPPYVRHY
jgi:hypothetical protein